MDVKLTYRGDYFVIYTNILNHYIIYLKPMLHVTYISF